MIGKYVKLNDDNWPIAQAWGNKVNKFKIISYEEASKISPYTLPRMGYIVLHRLTDIAVYSACENGVLETSWLSLVSSVNRKKVQVKLP